MRLNISLSHKPSQSRFTLMTVLVLIGMVMLLPQAQATTTVYFDGAGLVDGPIPEGFASYAVADGPGYGVSPGLSFVGTPDIYVAWHGVQFALDWDGRSSAGQLINPEGNASAIVFFGTGGMVLDSFDLDLSSGSAPIDASWVLTGVGGLAASGHWQRATPGRDRVMVQSNEVPLGANFLYTAS